MQANSNSVNQLKVETQATRADTAVRPNAELITVTKVVSVKPAVQRDAGWDVEREGRETKVEPPTKAVPLCTGDFGTSVRHPPRERIPTA